MQTIIQAAQEVIKTCRKTFSDMRWNCSSIELAPNYLLDLERGKQHCWLSWDWRLFVFVCACVCVLEIRRVLPLGGCEGTTKPTRAVLWDHIHHYTASHAHRLLGPRLGLPQLLQGRSPFWSAHATGSPGMNKGAKGGRRVHRRAYPYAPRANHITMKMPKSMCLLALLDVVSCWRVHLGNVLETSGAMAHLSCSELVCWLLCGTQTVVSHFLGNICLAQEAKLEFLSLSGTRESAFVYALSAAAISHTIARACTTGDLPGCSCGPIPGETPGPGYRWGGCADNLNYGLIMGSKFSDAPMKMKKSGSQANKLMHLHNSEVGRQVTNPQELLYLYNHL